MERTPPKNVRHAQARKEIFTPENTRNLYDATAAQDHFLQYRRACMHAEVRMLKCYRSSWCSRQPAEAAPVKRWDATNAQIWSGRMMQVARAPDACLHVHVAALLCRSLDSRKQDFQASRRCRMPLVVSKWTAMPASRKHSA